MSSIFLIGAFPPPVHGFSNVMAAVASRLEGRSHIHRVNRTPYFRFNKKAFAIFALPFHILSFIKFLYDCAVKKPTSFYFGLSGGFGLYIDLLYLLVARLRGGKVVLHHHNFTYVNRKFWSMQLLLRIQPAAQHIFLCNCMLDKFSIKYSDFISSKFVGWVISNHAFVDNQAKVLGDSDFSNGPKMSVVLGFLSNITLEKGILEFVQLCDYLHQLKIPVKGMVGGPVSDSDPRKILSTFSERPYIDYRGAIYGKDKADFFDEIDFLIFPSKYANEAEPLVVIEATSYGVPVIASNIGCLNELVIDDMGIALDFNSTEWRKSACDFILKSMRIHSLNSSDIIKLFQSRRDLANKQVEHILNYLID